MSIALVTLRSCAAKERTLEDIPLGLSGQGKGVAGISRNHGGDGAEMRRFSTRGRIASRIYACSNGFTKTRLCLSAGLRLDCSSAFGFAFSFHLRNSEPCASKLRRPAGIELSEERFCWSFRPRAGLRHATWLASWRAGNCYFRRRACFAIERLHKMRCNSS
jgi:hypothetical protein